MRREELLFLSYLGLGFKRYSYIKENFGSISSIPNSSIEEVSKVLKIRKETIITAKEGGIEKSIVEIEKTLKRYGVEYLTLEDENYPYRLRALSDRPIVIYYLGNYHLLNSSVTCGIVGTRRNDEIGKNYTKKLVDLLVDNNVTVVSGLARGIDIIAHRRTLERNGQTIAVLAGGLDCIYPPEHKKEFDEIREKGCVISEFTIGTKPLRRNFFIRNRIISGLSDVVVIVQAPEKSGALITGEYALKQKKPLLVIPGGIENYLHRGCNIMLKKGAIPILDYKDVLEELGYKATQNNPFQETNQELSEEEKFIYSFITKEISLDELTEATGLSINKIYPILLSLEVKGMIIQNVGGTFSRTIYSSQQNYL
ncbi:MAG: DNA-processing protein DprA [Brevinematia bacterium]